MFLKAVIATLLIGASLQASAYEISSEANGTGLDQQTTLSEDILPLRRRGRRWLRRGERAYNIERDSALVEIIDREERGTYVVLFLSGSLRGKYGNNWGRQDLARTRGCAVRCVGDNGFNVERDSAAIQVVGIQYDGNYVVEFKSGPLRGKRGGKWTDSNLAFEGCAGRFCTGERAFNATRDSALIRVVGVQNNDRFVVEFLDGSLRGKRGHNWADSDLAKKNGCGDRFCVGDFALNKTRNYSRVKIVGIQHNGRYVIKFLSGSLRGKRGSNWSDRDLARDRR